MKAWETGRSHAVCDRVQAHYMDRDVYGSDWFKAAAMLESIAWHEPLEAKNGRSYRKRCCSSS